MKTSEFLNTLKENQHMELVFTYGNGGQITPGYHITEVKNILVDSVDCGGQTDQWRETVIQLWEAPGNHGDNTYMTALKALGILNKVDSLRPMDKEAVVKFEYGNPGFHTSNLAVGSIEKSGKRVTVALEVVPTDCKAKSTCGVPEPAGIGATSNCEPGSGCC